MSDAVLIREAASIGLDERVARLLPLLPILTWVWSAGEITEAEAAQFMRVARTRFELEELAWPTLERWLAHKQASGFSVRGRNVVIALVRRQRGKWIAPLGQEDLVDLSRAVARAVTSLYGLRRMVRSEGEALAEMVAIFADRPGPVWPALGTDPGDDATDGVEDEADPPTDVGVALPPRPRLVGVGRAVPAVPTRRPVAVQLTRMDAGITAIVEGSGEISVGRTRNNTFQILDDGEVSRHHCRLFDRDGAWFVEDLGSMNGTRVNGEIVRLRQIFGGEELVIGNTIYRFEARFGAETGSEATSEAT